MKFWVKNIFFVSCILFFVCNLFLVSFVQAKYTASNATGFIDQMNKGVGAETVDYKTFTAKIVQGGLGVVGLVFFILVFYGGYLWLAARGKDEDIKKAQDTIIAAIIGLMIVVGSYALTNFVFSKLVGKPTSGQPSAPAGQQADGTTPTGPLGCCLDEMRIPGSILSANEKHWYSSITDEATCAEQGNTCGTDDEICGATKGQYWQFYSEITKEEECLKLREITDTN